MVNKFSSHLPGSGGAALYPTDQQAKIAFFGMMLPQWKQRFVLNGSNELADPNFTIHRLIGCMQTQEAQMNGVTNQGRIPRSPNRRTPGRARRSPYSPYRNTRNHPYPSRFGSNPCRSHSHQQGFNSHQQNRTPFRTPHQPTGRSNHTPNPRGSFGNQFRRPGNYQRSPPPFPSPSRPSPTPSNRRGDGYFQQQNRNQSDNRPSSSNRSNPCNHDHYYSNENEYFPGSEDSSQTPHSHFPSGTQTEDVEQYYGEDQDYGNYDMQDHDVAEASYGNEDFYYGDDNYGEEGYDEQFAASYGEEEY